MRNACRFIPTCVAALAFLAAPAGAAQLAQIQWDVTGGTFASFFLANGPITSGTLTWTPGGGVFSYSPGVDAVSTGGTFDLLLQGTGQNQFSYVGNAGSLSRFGTGLLLGRFYNGLAFSKGNLHPTAEPTEGLYVRRWFGVYTGGTGFGRVEGYSGWKKGAGYATHLPITHEFTLGNEVRTLVPEPGSGSLFGLGLAAGLGTAAVRARRRRRA
jgi:hypothetical protein